MRLVTEYGVREYEVPSDFSTHTTYRVFIGDTAVLDRCTCPDFVKRGKAVRAEKCKHIRRARVVDSNRFAEGDFRRLTATEVMLRDASVDVVGWFERIERDVRRLEFRLDNDQHTHDGATSPPRRV